MGGHNQLLQLLSVLVIIILFKGVTSDIDDGSFVENGFRRFNGLYNFFHVCIFKYINCHLHHNEIITLSYYNDNFTINYFRYHCVGSVPRILRCAITSYRKSFLAKSWKSRWDFRSFRGSVRKTRNFSSWRSDLGLWVRIIDYHNKIGSKTNLCFRITE